MSDEILCNPCRKVISGEAAMVTPSTRYPPLWDRLPSFDFLHHESFETFEAGKEARCTLCNWLWERYSLSHEEESAPPQGFRTYCAVDGESWGGHLIFYIVCPPASDFELRVYISRQQRQLSGHSYPRLGPRDYLPGEVMQTRPWSRLNKNMGSDQSLQQINTWISNCRTHHGVCDHMHSTSFFPTRVIDVANISHGKVSLRHREGIRETAPIYLTLSHRWGNPKDLLQLVKEKEGEFKRGIRVKNLRKTFQDAMWLVHRLGYRYLWIDSLCIFQDSEEDFLKEAGSMVNVYRHSLCNIAAISSSYDSDLGLFNDRRVDPQLLYPVSVNLKRTYAGTQGPDEQWNVWNADLWENEIENVPLSLRGWVVQERFLASRVIHFAPNQIYWECLEHTSCEADPANRLALLNVKGNPGRTASVSSVYKSSMIVVAQMLARMKKQGLKPSDLDWRSTRPPWPDLGSHHPHWENLIATYSKCGLSKESDRLIAMSGIAKVFQEVDGDGYLAGLWRRSLHTNLLWTSDALYGANVMRSKEYAPSWSWSSIYNGTVEFFSVSVPVSRLSRGPQPLVNLVDARIQPKHPGGDLMGLLRSAELDIDCCLLYFQVDGEAKDLHIYSDASMETHILTVIQTEYTLFLDTRDLVVQFSQNAKKGVCIPVARTYMSSAGGSVDFLLLERVSRLSGDKFRRLGKVRWSGVSQGFGYGYHMNKVITLV